MTSTGVLYIASGEKYIRAAMRSARSLGHHCPDLPTHLYADWKNYAGFDFERDPSPFTSVGMIQSPHRRSKLDYLTQSPFARTLYLDSDTLIAADIRGMFSLLDRFDLALAHAHRRNDRPHLAPWRTELPAAFPQYNGGVVLYRSTPEVVRFLSSWRDAFTAAGFLQDQISLRELLWLSDLRIATLPPEYNVRYIKYRWIWSRSEATPQIYHLRRLHVGWFWSLAGPWARRVRRLIKRLAATRAPRHSP
ncbi:MAG TPA: hypothetical protein VFH29_00120 [Anaerolineales bacterium]|nr:hypothetical protein [Anaerolineales bacterium]